MKFLIVVSLFIMSSPLFAAGNLHLKCQTYSGHEYFVEVVETAQEYFVDFTTYSFPATKVDHRKVTTTADGDIIGVEAAALWEGISISKVDGKWEGYYWFDLGYYPSTCMEI